MPGTLAEGGGGGWRLSDATCPGIAGTVARAARQRASVKVTTPLSSSTVNFTGTCCGSLSQT